jgi:potassium-transporting ATPase KdpC subunit
MLRRHLFTSLILTLIVGVGLGIVYPLAVYGIGQVAFPYRANGSLITRNGKTVGSALIGQEFLDNKGNPDPKYFQPRPSSAGNGYDPTASGASNLGPSDPRLVGFIPGFNAVDLNGNPSTTNPFATRDDPNCVPTDATSGAAVTSPSSGQKYATNPDGSYVCYANTVPERAIAYRQLNNLASDAKVPVDAVTASASGLDPDISVANADLQAARVAGARSLPVSTVTDLVRKHTNSAQWGFLGEKTVNVLDLNLALDALPT